MVLMSGDREEVRSVQRELKKELRRTKNSNKGRLESKLQQNNAKEVWKGMKKIAGLNSSGPAVEGSHELASELNQHFNRFDSAHTTGRLAGQVFPIHNPPAPARPTSAAILPLPILSSCPTAAAAGDSAEGSTAPSHPNILMTPPPLPQATFHIEPGETGAI